MKGKPKENGFDFELTENSKLPTELELVAVQLHI